MKKPKAKLHEQVMLTKSAPCKFCGCTDERACPGGCYWFDEDVCSACAIKKHLLKTGART